jgi:hypothetical protein
MNFAAVDAHRSGRTTPVPRDAHQRQSMGSTGGESTQRRRNAVQTKPTTSISWQITPRVLTEALVAGGDEAKRAFEAMMTMRKIDIAAIEAARRG